MNRNILYISLLLICNLCCWAQDQDNYRVGFAKMSIEPPPDIFGLSLAGYGIPAEGRFSITWEPIDSLKQLSAIAAEKVHLFVQDTENNWFIAEDNGRKLQWKENVLSGTEQKAVAVLGEHIYSLDKDGVLWWKNGRQNTTKVVSPDLKIITTDGNHLYAVDNTDIIYRGKTRRNTVEWTAIGKEEVAACAVYNGDVVFSDREDKLWKMHLNEDGTFRKEQIGRHNNATYTVKIKQLAVAHGRLYALDTDGRLFRSKHKTEQSMETGAVAIQYDNNNVLIITADVCGLDLSFTKKIKKEIAARHRIAEDAILINASHTHFAPVTQAWTTWAHFYQQPDSNYLHDVVGRNMIAVADKAMNAMEPASIYFGRGETYIGANRRDNVRKSEGPVDRTLDVIKILNAEQQLMGVVFFAGCHPVFHNEGEESFTLSANFPGIARRVLAEDIGCEHGLFVQGCGGDINPVSANYRQTGVTLGKDVLQVLSEDMQQVSGTLTAFVDSVLIPVKPMTREEITAFREKNAALRSDVGTEKNVRWADLMEKRYQTNSIRGEMPIYVQTLNIGSWKLVGLSREAVNSYGTNIRKIWPDHLVSVAGYCNDVASYLPDRWHIEKGVYEGYDSFFWYGQEGIPPLNVQELILDEIKLKNR